MRLFIIKKFKDSEYRVNVPLLYLTLFMLLSLVFLGFKYSDWSLESKTYIACSSKPMCFNELFNSPSCEKDLNIKYTPLCTLEYIPYGFEYGSKPSFFVKYSNELSVFILGLFLFLNTILFNKQFLKDFKVKL